MKGSYDLLAIALLFLVGFLQAINLLLLERFLQVATSLVKSTLSIVVGLQRLAIFVGGALALPGDVEDFAELDVAPDFGPSRFAIAVERVSIRVG